MQRLAMRVDASKTNMDMGMLGVEVFDGHPLERSKQIALHLLHHVPGELIEIDPGSELGREDQPPEPLGARGLPTLEALGNVDGSVLRIEACILRTRGALTAGVLGMRGPLSARLVTRVGDPNGTTLYVGALCLCEMVPPSPALCQARIMHQLLE